MLQNAEEIRQQLDMLGRRLEGAVKALYTTGEVRTLFDTASRFNDFSPENKILLTRAMPNATYVATREQWEKLGRTIAPGAKPVVLTVPGLVRGPGGSRCVRLRPAGFYDVSQTTGRKLLLGLEPRIFREDLLIQALREISRADGIPISLKSMKRYDGMCSSRLNKAGMVEQSISVRHDLDPQAMARTILHEIAHSLLHGHSHGPVVQAGPGGRKLTPEEELDICEVEAEAVAYIAASHFGIMDDLYSADYIGGYLPADAPGILSQQYRRILEAAASIVQRAELQYERELLTERCAEGPEPGNAVLYQLRDSQLMYAEQNSTLTVFDPRLYAAVCEVQLPDGYPADPQAAHRIASAVSTHPPEAYAGRTPSVTDVLVIGTESGPKRFMLERGGVREVQMGQVKMAERRPQKKAVPAWGRD